MAIARLNSPSQEVSLAVTDSRRCHDFSEPNDPNVFLYQSDGSLLQWGEFANTDYQTRYQRFTEDQGAAWSLVRKLVADFFGVELEDCRSWGDLRLAESESRGNEAEIQLVEQKSKQLLGQLHATGFMIHNEVYIECDHVPLDAPGLAAKCLARARNLPVDWVSAYWHLTIDNPGTTAQGYPRAELKFNLPIY